MSFALHAMPRASLSPVDPPIARIRPAAIVPIVPGFGATAPWSRLEA